MTHDDQGPSHGHIPQGQQPPYGQPQPYGQQPEQYGPYGPSAAPAPWPAEQHRRRGRGRPAVLAATGVVLAAAVAGGAL
ncbi:hypothetical protein G3I36_37090, partial [Streptomyces sp. SID10362]|nr:hypothetical protein [Streptomyces sp. SID10362]